MIKKVLAFTILMLGSCATINVQAIKPGEPIYISPSFEFRCFIDNFSVPGTISLATAIMSVLYLHKAAKAYIKRQTTTMLNQPVPENTMIEKAKNYCKAAAAWAAIAATFYFREQIKEGFAYIPQLLRRNS